MDKWTRTDSYDGVGLIMYSDLTNWGLKVAHYANPLCVNYFRRR